MAQPKRQRLLAAIKRLARSETGDPNASWIEWVDRRVLEGRTWAEIFALVAAEMRGEPFTQGWARWVMPRAFGRRRWQLLQAVRPAVRSTYTPDRRAAAAELMKRNRWTDSAKHGARVRAAWVRGAYERVITRTRSAEERERLSRARKAVWARPGFRERASRVMIAAKNRKRMEERDAA